jgi:hypothetical protein
MDRRSRSLRIATLPVAAMLACANPTEVASHSGDSGGAGATPEIASPLDEGEPAPDFELYRDPQERFQLEFPASLVLLDEAAALPDRNPPLDGRVRFQLRQLLGTDVEDLEPPPLTIEIFAADPASLRSWLGEHGWIGPRARTDSVEIEGAREAVWIRDPAQLAPNENLWISSGSWVYRLVPVGDLGGTALERFRLGTASTD